VLDKFLVSAKIGFWTALTIVVLQAGIVLTHASESMRDTADNFDKHLGNLEFIAQVTSANLTGVAERRLRDTNDVLNANLKLAIFGMNSRLVDTNNVLARGVIMASDHLVNTEAIFAKSLARANDSIKIVADNTTKVSKDVTRVSLPLASLAEQVNTAAPEFLNCDPSPAHPVGNAHCVPVVYTGIAHDIHQFTFDASGYVHHFTNPPPRSFKQKLLDGTVGLIVPTAKVYGALR
jgi:hypothetical protein